MVVGEVGMIFMFEQYIKTISSQKNRISRFDCNKFTTFLVSTLNFIVIIIKIQFMRIKILVIASIFFFFKTASFAQNKFIQGYIITSNKDTVRGFIDNSVLNKRVGNSLVFKKDQTDKNVEKFSPASIKGFYVQPTDEYYTSQEVTMDKKSVELNSLENNPLPHYSKESVFLKVLVKGKASLFYYVDEKFKEHFFLQKDSEPIFELAYLVYLVRENYSVTDEKFKKQMSELLTECPKLSYKSLTYKEGSLKKAIQAYNLCTNSTGNYASIEKKADIKYGLFVGMSSAQGNLSGDIPITTLASVPKVQNIAFNPSLSPVIGVSISMKPKWLQELLSLNFDCFYHKHAYVSEQTLSNFDKYAMNLSFSYLTITPSVSFVMKGKIAPYLKAGVNFSILNNYKNIYDYNVTIGTTNYPQKKEPFEKFQNYRTGPMIGLGVQMGQFALETHYEYSIFTPLRDNMYFKTTEFSVLLKYLFRFEKK